MKTALRSFRIRSAFFLLLLIFSLFIFAACSSGEESAVITISLGIDSMPGKTTVGIDQLKHIITFSGPTGTKSVTVVGVGTARVSVVPGLWYIDVGAYMGEELYAVGSTSVEVRAGQTSNALVQMTVVWVGDSAGVPRAPGDSGITIVVSPSSVAVEIGQAETFSALVLANDGTPAANQLVTWSLSGNASTATDIDSNGRLLVAATEPIGTVLDIKAVAVADSKKSGTAAVKVSNLATLTGSVSITGDNWANATLTATYTGSGTGTETIKWRRGGIEISGATGTTYLVADADRGKDITAAVQFSGNSGLVESSTYSIQNLTGIYDQDQLAVIRTNATTLGKNYILAVPSITLSGNWTPIGSSSTPFTGTFDGQNNTISGLTINTTAGNQGLFGYLSGGTVKNLSLTGVSISGGSNTGAVVGENSGGTIDNCSVAGSVSGTYHVGGVAGWNDGNGIIKNSFTTANIASTGAVETNGVYYSNVGGVVGVNRNFSTVENCYTTGATTGNSGDVGGVVGNNHGNSIVRNCYAEGNISGIFLVGGVVGGNADFGLIQGCYSLGNVTGSGYEVGGVVGINSGGTNPGTVEYCYATGIVTGSGESVGGIAGRNFYSILRNCVALNTTITRSGTGINCGRIVGLNDGGGTLTNNYANSGMTTNSGVAFVDSVTGKDGLGDTMSNIQATGGTWWSGGVFASVWGTTDSAPWQWNSTDQRPMLYFE